MANETLIKTGVQWLFADVTDFPNSGAGPPTTAANSFIVGSPTKVQFDLTAVAASGGSRASTKATLLTPWAEAFSCDACLEFETAPADGGVVLFYWAPSPSGTAATGNPSVLTGADEAHTDTVGTLGKMQLIGSLTVENTAINKGHVGVLVPLYEFGMLVIVNKASTQLKAAGGMDETHIVLTEVIRELQ